MGQKDLLSQAVPRDGCFTYQGVRMAVPVIPNPVPRDQAGRTRAVFRLWGKGKRPRVSLCRDLFQLVPSPPGKRPPTELLLDELKLDEFYERPTSA